jgi:hypothetical protein
MKPHFLSSQIVSVLPVVVDVLSVAVVDALSVAVVVALSVAVGQCNHFEQLGRLIDSEEVVALEYSEEVFALELKVGGLRLNPTIPWFGG